MPTRKHTAHREADEQETTTAAPPQAGADADDVQVLWRKKEAPRQTAHEPAAADATAVAEEEGGDWEARFKAEQAKADDYFARWQRAAADMANMRRRHEQERQEYLKQANASLIAELLPVLDSFDRALAAIPAEARDSTWIDGVKLVERQLRMVLERNGLSAIEAEGKPFDPTEHEALMHEPSEQPEDTVTGELQRGYKLHDRVLRPAMVKVAKGE
jgi:molecular chaperone GrpE